MVNRESSQICQWIEEVTDIRKEQDKLMNQDKVPTNFFTSTTICLLWRHLAACREKWFQRMQPAEMSAAAKTVVI